MNKTKNKEKKIIGRMFIQMIMIILIVLCISYVCLYILFKAIVASGILIFKFDYRFKYFSPYFSLLMLICFSSILGIIASIYLSRKFLKPIENLKEMTNKVANGDFEAKISDVPFNEVGELIENFNTMVCELKKNETLKSDFISNVSHEFKTPLSSIQGYATLLQDESLSKSEKERYLKCIIQSTSSLSELVNNILKITKIDNQKISIEKQNYELDEQIRESILSFENEWNNKEIEFDLELEKIHINADKVLMVNVWNNLISNAIKYSHPKGVIHIRLYQEDKKIIIIIKDEGIGIPQESLPYIFDKFYQVEKSHNGEGNGLGLALVKKIVNLSNGTIKVNSKINQGSEFIITLPL